MSAEKEVVLLIHGTGAGKRSTSELPEERRWWERESRFWSYLQDEELESLAPGRFRLSDEFTWGDGGLNSERVRRSAGVALAEHLLVMEERGEVYHLVGHSHGGSVIWHALVHAAAHGYGELPGLKSWTSVGTPFLRFRPNLLMAWPVIPLTVGLAGLIWFIWLHPDIIGGIAAATVWSETWLELVWFGALSVLLLASVTGLLISTGKSLAGLLHDRIEAHNTAKAALVFGNRYTCLYHPQDEPINGLRISTFPESKFVPRPTTTEIRQIWRWCLRQISELWSKPVDQLTWETISRRLQGDDLPAHRLLEVSVQPYPLSNRSPGFSDQELHLMSGLADGNSLNIARNARRLLQEKANNTGSPVSIGDLGGVVEWSGIVHTSYFEASATVETIAKVLVHGALETDANASASPHGAGAGQRLRFRFRPVALTISKSLIASGVMFGMLALAGNAASTAVVPFTASGLVDNLVNEMSAPAMWRVKRTNLYAEIGHRLGQLPFSNDFPSAKTLSDYLDERWNRSSSSRTLSHQHYVESLAALDKRLAKPNGRATTSKLSVRQCNKEDPLLMGDLMALLDRKIGWEDWPIEFQTCARLRLSQTDYNAREFDIYSDYDPDAMKVAQDHLAAELDVPTDLAKKPAVDKKQTPTTCKKHNALAAILVDHGEVARAAALATNCTTRNLATSRFVLSRKCNFRQPWFTSIGRYVYKNKKVLERRNKWMKGGAGRDNAEPNLDLNAFLLRVAILQNLEKWQDAANFVSEFHTGELWNQRDKQFLKVNVPEYVRMPTWSGWEVLAARFKEAGLVDAADQVLELMISAFRLSIQSSAHSQFNKDSTARDSILSTQAVFGILLNLGRTQRAYELAEALLNDSNNQDNDAQPGQNSLLAGIGYAATGKTDLAIKLFRPHVERKLMRDPVSQETAYADYALAAMLYSAKAERFEFTLQALNKLLNLAAKELDTNRSDYFYSYSARVFAQLGNYISTISTLRKIANPETKLQTIADIALVMLNDLVGESTSATTLQPARDRAVIYDAQRRSLCVES